MKKLIIMLLFLLASTLAAREFLSYQVAGRWPLLVKIDNLIFSSHCEPLIEQHKCKLNSKLGEARRDKNKKLNLSGGKNPAAVVCYELLQGKVLVARDIHGHSSSFCTFDDDSMISADSAVYFLRAKGVIK